MNFALLNFPSGRIFGRCARKIDSLFIIGFCPAAVVVPCQGDLCRYSRDILKNVLILFVSAGRGAFVHFFLDEKTNQKNQAALKLQRSGPAPARK